MQTPENDTISAIITPIGTGGIAVIRTSGPGSIAIADGIFRGNAKLSGVPSHTVHFGRIDDPAGNEVDEVLVTVFRAPHSYTAEDVVEISCHGSPYIARRILDLVVTNGARPADPGEFTKRAFLNGRIDLSQAEAVADLINADSRASHDLAIAQLRGTLSGKISELRRRIVDLCSTLELELDFSEEGLEFIKRDELREDLVSVGQDITQLIDSFELGKIYKEGLRVVLAGAPNVGKSSILNALVREDRAIVTSISGTTRDTIEESISIAGLKFTVVDTAGLRSTHDIVEAEGIRRTRDQIRYSDLILFVVDPTQDVKLQVDAVFGDKGALAELTNRILIIVNKVDLLTPEQVQNVREMFSPLQAVVTSALNGIGISELERVVSSKFLDTPREPTGETVVVSSLRQKESLFRTRSSLQMVLDGVEDGATPELLAVDLRLALTHLSHVVGVDISEEVLNNIFSRFCIGK
jgi:tRNA modification GTPase